eukprot:7381668-Prymnesium_polylepis.3
MSAPSAKTPSTAMEKTPPSSQTSPKARRTTNPSSSAPTRYAARVRLPRARVSEAYPSSIAAAAAVLAHASSVGGSAGGMAAKVGSASARAGAGGGAAVKVNA